MISIVIPAYNEIDRLPRYLKEWMIFLDNLDKRYEIIIVDDGSTDGLKTKLESWSEYGEKFVVISQTNQGKGAAVKKGVLESSGDLILFCDADGATPVGEISSLLSCFDDEKYPIVIGSRQIVFGRNVIRRNKIRHLAGRVFAFFMLLITGLKVHDTQCGFKLFSKDAAHKIFALSSTKGWAFDVELLLLAKELGFGVCEVPISWVHQPGSKVRFFRDGFLMFIEVIKIYNRVSNIKLTTKDIKS